MNRPPTTRFPRLAALAAALAMAAAPAPLAAASPCSLGFLLRSAPTIDGRDGDWADASRATSASDACVGKLLNSEMESFDVTVFTKRYMRGGTLYLGFLFEVYDATREKTPGGGRLTNGERIAIQFDHNLSGGGQLEAADRRLIITHRWEPSVPDTMEVMNVQSVWSTGTRASTFCPGGPGPLWADVGDPVGYSEKVRKDFPGGYRVELEFPAAAVGGVSGDFGVAFQVVNDWGTTTEDPGSLNSAASSFPSSLPYNSQDKAVDGCNNLWRVPGNWGTGFWAGAVGDVTISRLPVPWQSMDIVPLACGTPGYAYYPVTPCKLTLQGTVHSTFTTPQTRNLLYLWADHGASPSVWRVIGMKKNVQIRAGSPTTPTDTTVLADEWTTVPKNLPHHPCVRVYILPPVFQAAFGEADIMGIDDAEKLGQMERVYGVQTQHWAQKNISSPGDGDCPNGSCRVAALEGAGPRLAAYFGGRTGWPFAVRELAAQETPWPDTTRRDNPIFLSPRDRRTLGTDNALVQVRAWGYSAGEPTDSLSYVLAENLGGLLQAIPLDQRRAEDDGRGWSGAGVRAVRQPDEEQQWPLTFTLGNPGRYDRTVFVTVETEVPRGALEVRLDVPRTVFKANEQRVVRGTLVHTDTGPQPTPGRRRHCPMGFGLAAAGLAALGLARRPRRRA